MLKRFVSLRVPCIVFACILASSCLSSTSASSVSFGGLAFDNDDIKITRQVLLQALSFATDTCTDVNTHGIAWNLLFKPTLPSSSGSTSSTEKDYFYVSSKYHPLKKFHIRELM